ncbi:UNVERIFIED_ORG: hypothetical protein B2H98_13995 [Clostridium botulinum]
MDNRNSQKIVFLIELFTAEMWIGILVTNLMKHNLSINEIKIGFVLAVITIVTQAINIMVYATRIMKIKMED